MFGFEIVDVYMGSVYEVEIVEGEWMFFVFVELSFDGSMLWGMIVLYEFIGCLEDYGM